MWSVDAALSRGFGRLQKKRLGFSGTRTMRTTAEDWAARQKKEPTALQFRQGILVDDQRKEW